MADGAGESTTPPRTHLRIGQLDSAAQVRRACVRITNGVLSGRIPPRIANSAIYAIGAASKALEIEHLESLQSQLSALRNQDLPALPLTIDMEPVATRQ
jgi:hypothetical protein